MTEKRKMTAVLAGLLLISLAATAMNAKMNPQQAIHVEGRSMEPFSIYGGTTIKIYTNREPKTGDLVSFKCAAEKCPAASLVKLLKERRGDCFWFEGREPYTDENGETRHSVDSRIFGWVCKPDIIIHGVVKA